MVIKLRRNFDRELRLVVVEGRSQTWPGFVELPERLVCYVVVVWYVVVW